MNVNNIRLVADAIEAGSPNLKFDMATFNDGDSCNTAACIAGWACFVVDGKMPEFDQEIMGRAEDILGLDVGQSHNVFYGHWDDTYRVGELETIPATKAIDYLRRCADAGKVL